MATVKLKFRPSTVADRPGTIVYFITHRRIVRQITTEYKVFSDEWDEKMSKLLAEKYNYVSSYILREERNISIKTGDEDDIRSSSVRVYGETMDRWKEFVKKNRAYSATDLLNTAMLEFMERH